MQLGDGPSGGGWVQRGRMGPAGRMGPVPVAALTAPARVGGGQGSTTTRKTPFDRSWATRNAWGASSIPNRWVISICGSSGRAASSSAALAKSRRPTFKQG